MILSMRKTMTKKGQTMAFLQVEDRVTRLEAIVFPRTWLNVGHLLHTGGVVVLTGHVQRDEEDAEDDNLTKLIVDEVLDLGQVQSPADADHVRGKLAYYGKRAGKDRQGRDVRPGKSSEQGRGVPAGKSTEQGQGAPQGQDRQPSVARHHARARADQTQKLWIRIDADKEDTKTWQVLKQLLRDHPGPMTILVYYVATKKSIKLNESYNVKPSPTLIAAIQALLGEGSAVVR
jgi:DNA polymerase-3 subunit alpha